MAELISSDMLCMHGLPKISFAREYPIILSRMSNLNLILGPTIANWLSAAKSQVGSMVSVLNFDSWGP